MRPDFKTFDLNPDQFLELCADERWRIVSFQRTAGGWRVQAVETGTKAQEDTETEPRLPYADE